MKRNERYTDPLYPEWIDADAQTPEKWKHKNGEFVNYLVYIPDYGDVDISNYVKPANRWVCMGIPVKVSAWMPMPEV